MGVLPSAALFPLAVSGFRMWRRRKPFDTLGAPPPAGSRAPEVVAAAILFMAALLPLLAASLIPLWTCERLLMPRLPSFASWRGSGLIAQSRKMTVGARAPAETKAFGHRSMRVATRLQPWRRPNMGTEERREGKEGGRR